MTRRIDIVAAEKLRVDFIGLIFVPSSPRSVTIDEAKQLRRHIRSATLVGVFADHPADQINEYAKALRLDVVQLHGQPDVEKIQNVRTPVIQAFRGVPNEKIFKTFLNFCPYILIDKAESEHEADFASIALLPSDIRSKLFLAGGLTPANIRTAAEKIQPFAVDCARGIESRPGIKNHDSMLDFFRSLR